MTIFFIMEPRSKLSISVVIVALNEEFNIGRAIASVVNWADEVIVYDSGSIDKTKEVALKLGAKFVAGEWLGFGMTKRKAASLAKNSWILSIDCDEEVSEELRNEISEKFNFLKTSTAYKVPRSSYYLKRWIRHGGWYPDLQARLFNRDFSNWNSVNIHEKVEAENYEKLISNLNHYVFKNIEHQVATNNKYSSLQALEMQKRKIHFSWFHFFTKPTVKFVECYLLKLGFLDGWPGFVIARSAAYSVFLKWSKLYELERIK